ncbi:MAG: CUAEP/CCAEP-tail radical SAM protein [bacterium]
MAKQAVLPGTGGPVVLISCYELGHQPMGIASPAGFLERAGIAALLLDLSRQPLDEAAVRDAALVAISTPMHTALRLALPVAEKIRRINPACHICFYGLYAGLNSDTLLGRHADSVIAGEAEQPLLGLVRAVGGLRGGGRGSLDGDSLEGVSFVGQRRGPWLGRTHHAAPARGGLPPIGQYSRLLGRDGSVPVGYVETTRGCKHLCLHCPITPVYGGRFFAVSQEVVLGEIGRLVEEGAGHITFGDPDFLNGPSHGVAIVSQMHRSFPQLTFDFTAKISHLLAHAALLPRLARQGCLFVVSAVESLAPKVLQNLAKGHTRQDVEAVLAALRGAGIALRPSLMPFTPWSSLTDYLDLLGFVFGEGLVNHLEPVQWSVRLLVPPGSALLDTPQFAPFQGPLDDTLLTHLWSHPDPRMDRLQLEVAALAEEAATLDETAERTFAKIAGVAFAAAGQPERLELFLAAGPPQPSAPRLSEPWFC